MSVDLVLALSRTVDVRIVHTIVYLHVFICVIFVLICVFKKYVVACIHRKTKGCFFLK